MRDRVERLNTFIDCLNAERRPVPECLTAHEVGQRLVAVHLHLERPDVAEPEPAFLRGLERAVRRAVRAERRRQGSSSRVMPCHDVRGLHHVLSFLDRILISLCIDS